MLADGLHDLAAFDDRVGQRLLAVDVFAGLGGVNAAQGVPVVGRGHDHGIDVLAVKQGPVVLVHALGPHLAGHLFRPREVDVGDRRHARPLGERADEPRALIAHTDPADHDPLVGPEGPGWNEGGGRAGRDGGSEAGREAGAKQGATVEAGSHGMILNGERGRRTNARPRFIRPATAWPRPCGPTLSRP